MLKEDNFLRVEVRYSVIEEDGLRILRQDSFRLSGRDKQEEELTYKYISQICKTSKDFEICFSRHNKA